ncbi:hypothetical protein [Ralstonia sp. GP71]|uniref:hypothetical protein n=1 Tax=Ralstonia sp. GP71 TaxID=3035152 RepID=UPI0038912F6A
MKKPMQILSVVALVATTAEAWGMSAANPQAWANPEGTTSAAAPSVLGGSAPIDQALSIIIPEPWKITLAANVPGSLMMTWPSSSDWRAALRSACDDMGLRASIDPVRQTVMVAPVRVTNPAPAKPLAEDAITAALPPENAPAAAASDSTQKPDALVQVGRTGAELNGTWRESVPAGERVMLVEAIPRLLPASESKDEVQIIGLDAKTPVTWKAGPRLQALTSVASQVGARISVTPGSEVVATRAMPPGREAPATSVPVAQAAVAPEKDCCHSIAGHHPQRGPTPRPATHVHRQSTRLDGGLERRPRLDGASPSRFRR